MQTCPSEATGVTTRLLQSLSRGPVRLYRFAARVVGAFMQHRGFLLAGGVGYNTLLSLVPFLTVTVAALSLFFDTDRILDTLRLQLTTLVPQHADLLLQSARSFLENGAAIGAVSVAFLLFFSSVAFRMLEQAVDAMFVTSSEGAHRPFWKSALLPYVFILPLVAGLFLMTLLTVGLDALGDGTTRIFGLELSVAYGVGLVLRVVGFVGLVLFFAGLYRVLPAVKISTRRAVIGGLCAAVLWRGTGAAVALYLANVSTVSTVYGSLATVVVVLLFLEVAFVILLLGAQVIAELEASSAAGLPWYEQPRARGGMAVSRSRPARARRSRARARTLACGGRSGCALRGVDRRLRPLWQESKIDTLSRARARARARARLRSVLAATR